MNKTISLAAIAMVAVIMGMSAFAPAAMATPNENAKADIPICHWGTGPDGEKGTEDDAWEVIYVHSEGATKGHVDRHNDGADEPTYDKLITDEFDEFDCTSQNDAGDS